MQPKHFKVMVIGAGASGLATIKELTQCGINDCLCVEQLAKLGGVFARYTYDGFLFTSSTKTTVFSDFPWKEKPCHWTTAQALQYLNDYADHFKIRDKFKF